MLCVHNNSTTYSTLCSCVKRKSKYNRSCDYDVPDIDRRYYSTCSILKKKKKNKEIDIKSYTFYFLLLSMS